MAVDTAELTTWAGGTWPEPNGARGTLDPQLLPAGPDAVGRPSVSAISEAISSLRAGDADRARTAAAVAARSAEEDGGPGWSAFVMIVRAATLLRARLFGGPGDAIEDPLADRRAAVVDGLDDLVQAEVALGYADPGLLTATVHAEIAALYRALGLYELALPHAETAAAQFDPQTVQPALDLALLHLDWADELDRVQRRTEYRTHVSAAFGWWQQADRRLRESAAVPDRQWFRPGVAPVADIALRCLVEVVGADLQARLGPEVGLAAVVRVLRSAEAPVHRAMAARALARALAEIGRTVEALAAAQRALETTEQTGPGTRTAPGGGAGSTRELADARHLLHRAQVAAGLPGATQVAALVTLYHGDLWAQRRNAMDGVRARRSLAALRARQAESHRLTLLDPLTEVGNRRALDDWQRQHTQGPATAVMVDVDNFKSINDRFGHALGDLVLRRVAQSLRRNAVGQLGPDGLVARYGGDEFAVMVAAHPLTSLVHQVVARAAADVEIGDLVAGLEIRLTLGVGSASAGQVAVDLLDAADHAMLAAKRLRTGGGRSTRRTRQ